MHGQELFWLQAEKQDQNRSFALVQGQTKSDLVFVTRSDLSGGTVRNNDQRRMSEVERLGPVISDLNGTAIKLQSNKNTVDQPEAF